MMLGSDAEQVLRMAPVPVLLVRCGDEEKVSKEGATGAATTAARTGAATV
jgi:hypothetical protein